MCIAYCCYIWMTKHICKNVYFMLYIIISVIIYNVCLCTIVWSCICVCVCVCVLQYMKVQLCLWMLYCSTVFDCMIISDSALSSLLFVHHIFVIQVYNELLFTSNYVLLGVEVCMLRGEGSIIILNKHCF